MNEYVTQGWVARDLNGDLWIYLDEKPEKESVAWCAYGWHFRKINESETLPSVKWEDPEPTEVEITIKLKSK